MFDTTKQIVKDWSDGLIVCMHGGRGNYPTGAEGCFGAFLITLIVAIGGILCILAVLSHMIGR